MPTLRGLRRAAENVDRQDPEIQAARNGGKRRTEEGGRRTERKNSMTDGVIRPLSSVFRRLKTRPPTSREAGGSTHTDCFANLSARALATRGGGVRFRPSHAACDASTREWSDHQWTD